VVLLSVINLQGSAPRHEGTKMVVSSNGKTYGTIGGSLLEATAIHESKKALAAKKSRVFTFDMTGKAADPTMICGGTAEIVLDYLAPTPANLEFSKLWVEAVTLGNSFFLLTRIKGEGESFHVHGHAIIQKGKALSPDSSLSPQDIDRLKKELHTVSSSALLSLNDAQVMVDRIQNIKTLYCFGAGHVAVPTAHLAALTGFRVFVLDNRPEYATTERFPEADDVIVIDDYSKALSGLDIDEDSYIVIVTHGHQFDHIVLEQALKVSPGYIGMISSKTKRQAIFEALMARGETKERLDWVHSPIGVNIGGETPEEIAVSIVAELIMVRSQTK